MYRKVWLLVLLITLVVAACRDGGGVDETGPGTAAPAETVQATTAASAPEETTESQEAQEPQVGRMAKDPAQAESQTQAAETPGPLPTADPQLPEWTIMVYMDAGDGLAQAALRDLNGLEAAGESVRVNVLAQAQVAGAEGWSGARRYEMRYDEDPAQITSLLEDELGAVDMGDPAVLSDFVAWGMADYPANHYALIVWDHGGMGAGAGALGQGLQQGLSQAGRPRLDVVGFDAGRMSRLEVYSALQPHADFAVASSQPAIEPGWHYESLLRDLFTEPLVTPAELAQAMARRYFDFHSGERDNEFASMTTVDLRQFGAVTEAVAALAQALGRDPQLVLGEVAVARQAAGMGEVAAADLLRFASALSQRSAGPAIVEAAEGVLQALERAVLLQVSGARVQETGHISIYFPQQAEAYEEQRAAVGVPGWAEFLSAYYEAASENGAPPVVSAVLSGEEAIGAQRPAYLDLEVAGWHIDEVMATTARREEEGRLRLVANEVLAPKPASPGGEDALHRWPDGVREDFYVWDTTAAYISDGANGDFALLWPQGAQGNLLAVEGQYVTPGASEGREASLVFDANTGQLHAVWGYGAGGRDGTPQQITPQSGADFQLYNHYLAEDRSISYEPGVTLVFTEGASLAYDNYPLPSGDYVLQFEAETVGGHSGMAQAEVPVDNETLAPGLHAYLDPYYGFQFLYPLTWPAPQYDGAQLVTRDAEGDRHLTVSVFPQAGDETELKNVALETFGTVDVLYETQASAGGQPALLTAYGYDTEGAGRTGLMAAFAHSEELGFVVDLDAPAEAEAETIELMESILSGWQFRPVGLGAGPGQWTRREVGGPEMGGPGTGGLQMAVPSDYAYERLENGWERFSSGDVFVALRTEPASGAGRPDIVARWLKVAGNGVEAFEAAAPERFVLSQTAWSRAEFSYEGSAGTIQGFIMATIVDGREVVAWSEAPAADYEALQTDVFLVMLADALAGADDSGLLYEETFDAPGNWGAGGVEGAEAAVADGAYRLAVDAEQGFFWATAGQSFADGVFEVEAVQTAGPLDNGYGLLLRADGESESFYVLEISGDGYVWIGRCRQGCAQPETLVGEGWFFSDAVRQGLDARNRLRVEALDVSLRFFVNGEEVGRVEVPMQGADAAPGDVGLFVETLGEGGVAVAFDNVRVVAP